MDMKSLNKKRIFEKVTIIIALIVAAYIGGAVLAIVIGGAPNLIEALKSEEVHFSAMMSFVTATISTAIVICLAMPTAYALTRTKMKGKRIVGVLVELTLSLPYILLGLALLIMFSTDFGKSLKEAGIKVVLAPLGIVFAQMLVNLPYAIKLIKTSFEQIDLRLEFISQTLGASQFQCFRTVTLPICKHDIISIIMLTWSRALGEFGATLMLVGITKFKTETLPGCIYLSISTGDTSMAMATATLMLIISGTIMAVVNVLNRTGRNSRIKEN